jgi:multidrug efflux pump subunit AcrA (membrane-fusion protein)
MLKRLFTLLALLVSGSLLAACDTGSSAATPSRAPQTPVRESGNVVSEGTVVPVRWAELSYSAGGTISDVLITEGSTARAGQTLVRLDSRRPMQAVNQAESGLTRAHAGQARAQAAVARYQAALALLKADPRAEDIATAAAAVGVAQAQLAKAQAGADTTARAQAKANMDKAARAVQQAQAQYDRIKDTPFGNTGPDALRLEQTTIEYDAAKTTYEQLVLGPRDTDIDVVKAQLAQASAALAQA